MRNLETRTDQQSNSDTYRKGLPPENLESLLYKTVIITATSIQVELDDPRLIKTVVEFIADNFKSGRAPIVSQHLPALLEGTIRRIKIPQRVI